jgi:hypothetical protein
MTTEPVVGQCVYIARNSGRHGGKVGSRMVITRVDDDDNTVRGYVDGSASVADFWVPWRDLEPVGFGWDYVRSHLPPEVVTLLAACDGVHSLALNDEVRLTVLASLPDLRERITAAAREVDAADDFDF